ncbi:MAG: hypothetical protein ABJA67_03985 [Chthonomonadales bacterium]
MRFNRSARFLVAAVAAIGFISAGFQTARADDGFMLKQKYKEGDVDKYKMTMSIEGAVSIEVTIVTQETVKKVAMDGTVTVENKVVSSALSVGGNEQPLPGQAAGTITTITYDKAGKVIKREGGGGGRGAAGMMGLAKPNYLPEKALKAGEEYPFEFTEKQGDATQTAKGVIKVVGLEKDSKDLKGASGIKATIKADAVMTGPMGEMKPHTEGTIFVDPDTGKMLLFKANVTGMEIPNLGEAKVAIVRTLVKADPK